MAKITMAGSYVALITPFTESDEVDYAKIEELVEWHVAEGYELCLLSRRVGFCFCCLLC